MTWELHFAVVRKLAEDPSEIIKSALLQVNVMKVIQRNTISRGWMIRWQELLRGDIEVLKTAMLDTDYEAEDLRQTSPYIGVLSQEERLLAIKKAAFQPQE